MREIFIERKNKVLRIAIKQSGKLKELFIEEATTKPCYGEIYRGVVKNIVPGIKCAFVDIGSGKNAYMYLDNKFNNTKIKKGEELVLQVVKEDLGNKGCKVTNAISLPGRYTVLMTLDKEITFSKKIENNEFRNQVEKNLIKPEDLGVMIRTNGENVDIEVLNKEIESLSMIYEEIKRKSMYSIKPGLIHSDEGAVDKILRDKIASSNNIIIYCDSQEDYKHIDSFIKEGSDINASVFLHEENRTLLDYYGIEKEILYLRSNRVHLECGGYIVIDKTEAMYVVDVNSGKNVKGSSLQNTAFITNQQAASEIVRQIRLRNLSGIILIDFIDMEDKKEKERVMINLRQGFNDDKNKTTIYGFTELNLVQIARKRSGRSIYEHLEEACSTCHGKGNRIKFSYMCMLIRNEIIKIDVARELKDIHIEINQIYKNKIEEDIIAFVGDVEALEMRVYLTYTNKGNYNVEPLIFSSQIEVLKDYKIYG